jgi:hypothetical protein
MYLEDEESWLRKRVMRLRTLLRYTREPDTEAGLREFIAEAETRLELLQNRHRFGQQQQQIQPGGGRFGSLLRGLRRWKRAGTPVGAADA